MNWIDPQTWEHVLTTAGLVLAAIAGFIRYRTVRRKATVEERRALRSRELANLRKQLRLKELELEQCQKDRDRAERAVDLFGEVIGKEWIGH